MKEIISKILSREQYWIDSYETVFISSNNKSFIGALFKITKEQVNEDSGFLEYLLKLQEG